MQKSLSHNFGIAYLWNSSRVGIRGLRVPDVVVFLLSSVICNNSSPFLRYNFISDHGCDPSFQYGWGYDILR